MLELNTYEVKAWGGGTVTVQAESSDKAKRIACRILGRTSSNPVTGIRGMRARKVREVNQSQLKQRGVFNN